MITLIGAHPLAKDRDGRLLSRIGTIFPADGTLITLPGIHATQRSLYITILERKRREAGMQALTPEEQTAAYEESVDLIMEDDAVLIRPDPDRMDLAFRADELLQEIVPKHRVKFLNILNDRVRQSIKRRGECWRIAPLPKSAEEMKQMILASRIGIGGKEIYYYNRTTGTRILTYREMVKLGEMDDAGLRRHLSEIAVYSARRNRMGYPEIAFFKVDGGLSSADFAAYDFNSLPPDQLHAAYETLCKKFQAAVRPEFTQDDPDDPNWRRHMYAALIGQAGQAMTEEELLGLSSEFFLQIEWLPGGRIEEGELIFDSVFEQVPEGNGESSTAPHWDEKARGFIFNFMREYGDLEYVNIGRVVRSLSQRRGSRGRREVYIAEIKLRDHEREIVRMIRMQKWGVREHLDEGKDLLTALLESDEYTEYILDRRLGARQLGMNMPARVTARKIGERYFGARRELRGITIWSPYFERDYVYGEATDKIPPHRFSNPEFAIRFARLLGQAAAPNIIVGRVDSTTGEVLFDDGDEVLVEDPSGLPAEIVVSDHTGTFGEYRRELRELAPAYAAPLTRRLPHVPNREEFVRAYLDAFSEKFFHIQNDYRKRRRAFDTLFRGRRWDEGGSFAVRWCRVLQRLDRTDPNELKEIIRRNVKM